MELINCTGDVVTGDLITFEEAVFTGSYKRPRFAGTRVIKARVLSDSYGADKQQHTFRLHVIESSGAAGLVTGTVISRKGRNVYRHGTLREPWPDEAARRAALDEKHARGDAARRARAERKMEWA